MCASTSMHRLLVLVALSVISLCSSGDPSSATPSIHPACSSDRACWRRTPLASILPQVKITWDPPSKEDEATKTAKSKESVVLFDSGSNAEADTAAKSREEPKRQPPAQHLAPGWKAKNFTVGHVQVEWLPAIPERELKERMRYKTRYASPSATRRPLGRRSECSRRRV